MKCPHCGEELPEGYIYIPQEDTEIKPDESDELTSENAGSASGDAANIDAEHESIIHNSEDTAESNAEQHTSESNEIPIPVYMPELESKKLMHFNRRSAKIVAAVIAVAIVGGAAAFGISMHGKAELKDKLSGSWEASNSSFSSVSFFSGTITFDDNSLTYSESLGMIEINSQTAEYKIVSSDTIEINDIKYKIEFNGTNSMTITPGLSGTSSETWLKESSYTDQNYNDDQSESVI